jgi:hypothetical protein
VVWAQNGWLVGIGNPETSGAFMTVNPLLAAVSVAALSSFGSSAEALAIVYDRATAFCLRHAMNGEI